MYKARVNGKEVEISFPSPELDQVSINGETSDFDMIRESENRYHFIHKNQSYAVEVLGYDALTKKTSLVLNGERFEVDVQDGYDVLLDKLGLDLASTLKINELKAPMPGLVLRTMVEAGQEIKEGESLLVLEAMKMENVLKSPADAVVKSIEVKTGQAVEKNEILIHFE